MTTAHHFDLTTFFFFILLIGLSCTEDKTKLIESNKDAIIRTDKDFSRMSLSKGIRESFLYYAADEVILMRDGIHPIIGKDIMKKFFESRPRNNNFLEWEPKKADVSSAGDIGYTFGNWKLTGKNQSGNDTTMHGNYVTIWKKQNDGKWKFVLDGGNTTPPPESK